MAHFGIRSVPKCLKITTVSQKQTTVITQFAVYFILLRTRRPRSMWCVLGFHVACCAAVWLLVSLR